MHAMEQTGAKCCETLAIIDFHLNRAYGNHGSPYR
jgi:hypothetical protein